MIQVIAMLLDAAQYIFDSKLLTHPCKQGRPYVYFKPQSVLTDALQHKTAAKCDFTIWMKTKNVCCRKTSLAEVVKKKKMPFQAQILVHCFV